VVARLAQRGGFNVRLSPRAQAAGTVAEVNVPAAMVVGVTRPEAPGRPGEPATDHPMVPGQGTPGGELPSRLPLTGGMRMDPALRLTTGSPTTAPRGVPMRANGSEGNEAPAEPLAPAAGPTLPPAPAPGMAPRPAPVAGGPARSANGGLPGSLPSRRPGAALAGNPLAPEAARPGGFTPFGETAPSALPTVDRETARDRAMDRVQGHAGTQTSDVAPGAAKAGGPATAPAPAAAPSFEAPRIGELPRRTRGTALAGTPLAAPGGVPTPPDNAPSGQMFGTGPIEVTGEALNGAPAGRPAAPDEVTQDTLTIPAVPQGPTPGPIQGPPPEPAQDDDLATAGPGPRLGSGAPSTAKRPIRPFVQPRPTGPAGRAGAATARPPYRPGATSAQIGATAATAAAAAARARAAAAGRTPAPGTGLFAATGPATLPGGILRPTPPAPPHGSTGAAAAGLQGTVAPAPADPKPATIDPIGAGAPSFEAPAAPIRSSGPDASPTEVEARTAAAMRYQPADPDLPLIGDLPLLGPDDGSIEATTPIFDSISVWFSTDAPAPVEAADAAPRVIDLRDVPAGVGAGVGGTAGGSEAGTLPAGSSGSTGSTSSTSTGSTQVAPAAKAGAAAAGNRWAALGDQRWVATNARAAAEPEVAGSTGAGLPRRRPGANLLPSAVEAASGTTETSTTTQPGSPATVAPAQSAAPVAKPDPENVRGRLGSYQRGLTSARRARHLPGDRSTRSQLGDTESQPQDAGQTPADRGGDQ
jgi:hypothetical protein